MNTRRIISIYRDISVMPFYLENDKYYIDMNGLEPIDRKIDDFYSQTLSQEPIHISKSKLINAMAIFINDYLKFKRDLADLCIDREDFLAYMRQSVRRGGVVTYFEIKERLRYAMIPVICIDDMPVDVPEEFQLINENEKSSKNVILNHNNPFADITIQNQEFIYPDKNGKFQTLNFNVGYTMSKLEDDGKAAIVLQPDFKISKSNDRNKVTSAITMDDTITTPMPDKLGDRQLMYI